MAKQQHIISKKGLVVRAAAVVCASIIAISCIGFGFASAGNDASDDVLAPSITFTDSSTAVSSATPSEGLVLESAARRDISDRFDVIAAEEEAARIAAEEAARIDEQNKIAAGTAAKNSAYKGEAPSCADIDFTIGKAAFVEQWGARLNDYFAGSTLAGYGETFAEAAWNHSIDPRFSAAISNTESTKGANCFRAYNAWGWMGDTRWSSWEESIDAHAQGLSEGYGFTISVWAAKKYCPPTYMDWYTKTKNEMAKI